MRRERAAAGRDAKRLMGIHEATILITISITVSITVSITMRPCFSCMSILQKVQVPTWAQRHIIKKHYRKRKHERQSMFKKSMPPQTLFSRVCELLRSGLKISEEQCPRFLYYYTFASKVGVCPNRCGDFSATKTVKIVCNTKICEKCGRRWPSEVVTIYPCKKPFV